MEYLPINIRLRGRPVVLIGAGVVAARKARFLLAAGARLRVIAPQRDPAFDALAQTYEIAFEQRAFVPGDLETAELVIAATPDPAVNEAVYQEARQRSVPVNVVDSPDLCSFIFPAIVDRSPSRWRSAAAVQALCSPDVSAAVSKPCCRQPRPISPLLPVAIANVYARVRRAKMSVGVSGKTSLTGLSPSSF